MATKLKLPDLGEGIDDADVLTVLVRNGQTVAKDDPIIEVESEKASSVAKKCSIFGFAIVFGRRFLHEKIIFFIRFFFSPEISS